MVDLQVGSGTREERKRSSMRIDKDLIEQSRLNIESTDLLSVGGIAKPVVVEFDVEYAGSVWLNDRMKSAARGINDSHVAIADLWNVNATIRAGGFKVF